MTEYKPYGKPEGTNSETLEELRQIALRALGFADNGRIPEIPPLNERICRKCGTPGPCTPKDLICSYPACGNNLKNSRTNSKSHSFNTEEY